MSSLPRRMRTALVIDDDRIISGVATAFLEKKADEVLCVSNGYQALEKIKLYKENIDFILCDLQMPEIDGLQFLRHLSSYHYTGPIAVLSGVEPALLTLARTIAANYQLNMIGALEKPLNIRELSTLLDNSFDMNKKPERQVQPNFDKEDLAKAITRKEITLHYQPQLDARTVSVIGAEAFPVWIHPHFGVLPSQDFIALAENTGLIEDLTEHLLRIVCWDARRWTDLKHDFRTSLNLSGIALANIDLPDRLAFLAHCNSLEKSRLVLEISESKLLLWDALSLEVLARLKLHGFQLSIDDFGTTYSNMEEIREFPFGELKIDRSFVTGAPDNAKSTTIIEACIQLCRKNNIRCVATGVENKQELTHLVRKGIDVVQGPFLGAAMPFETAQNWVEQHLKKQQKKN